MNRARRSILLIIGLLCVIALPIAYRLGESNSPPAITGVTPTQMPPKPGNSVPTETQIDAPRLQENLAKLAAFPNRLAGTVMGRRAGDLILEQLQTVGFAAQNLLVQSIPVTQVEMNPDDCWLEQGGQRFPMLPMRPNGLALSVTPEEGIQAATVYLAHGRPEDLRDKAMAGRIAVFDFDCGSSWIEAFANGALAVIFVGPCEGDGHKWIPAHAPMPRFYVDAPIAQSAGLLTGQTVRLFSRSRFVPLEGRNIFAFIPGTQHPDEVVALACPYDTFGPIPLV